MESKSTLVLRRKESDEPPNLAQGSNDSEQKQYSTPLPMKRELDFVPCKL